MWKNKNLFLVLCSILFLLLSMGSVSASVNLTDGLVSYWFLNGSGFDYVGKSSNNNIVTAGTGAYFNTSGGYFGDGFAGTSLSNGYFVTSSTNSSWVSNTLSISFWVRVNNYATSGNTALFFMPSGTATHYVWYNTSDQHQYVFAGRTPNNINLYGASPLNSWNHFAYVVNTTTVSVYMNGVLVNSTSTTGSISSTINSMSIGRFNANTQIPNMFISDIAYYNRTLTPEEVLNLFQGARFPFTPPANFTITVLDEWNNSAVNNVSVIINGTTYTNSTGHIITTDVPISNSVLLNYTIVGPVTYYNKTFTNINISSVATNTLYKKYNFIVNSFSNVTIVNGTNYTRNLIATLNITCDTIGSTSMNTLINGVFNKANSVSCGGEGVSSLQNFTYSHSVEGNFTIQYELNSSVNNPLNNVNSAVYNFVSDLLPPNITVLNFTTSEGFGTVTNTFTMRCTDNIFGTLLYNMTFEGSNIFLGNLTNNTLQTNVTNTVYSTGAQTLTGRCSDLFSTTTSSITRTIYTNNITLIDEQDNIPFTIGNITGARVYYDDNQTFFDFKANNTNNVFFSSTLTSKLRFEFIYSTGVIITRWVDVSLVDSANLRVCIFKDNNINAFQQLITSTTEQPVAIKNVFSDCYIGVDYTRFAFQSDKILNAYTINSLYYLYTYNNNQRVYLASIDGSQESSINLDVLEFTGNEYNVNILRPVVSVQRLDNQTMKIIYFNPNNDSTNSVINIFNLDNSQTIYTQTLADPNSLTLFFDYSTLNNGTYNDTTLFKAVVTRTVDGRTLDTSLFFNLKGDTGTMPSELAFALSLILLIFGLTFTKPSFSLSWFGVFVVITSIIIINTAVSTVGLLLLQGISVIILLFILVTMFTGRTEVNIIQ